MYRSIIEKSFPDEIKSRMNSQTKMTDYQKMLKQFEEYGKKDGGQSGSLPEDQIKMLIGGAVIVIAAILIVLLIVSM